MYWHIAPSGCRFPFGYVYKVYAVAASHIANRQCTQFLKAGTRV